MIYFGYESFISKLYQLRQDVPNVVGLTLIARILANIDERIRRVMPDPPPPAPLTTGGASVPIAEPGSPAPQPE